MSPKVVDKEEKKSQIVVAAMQVFAKKGFAKSTINDIAVAAGIGKGTVYEYFSNKDQIIEESFVFFISSHEAGFRELLELQLPALEKFKKIIDGFAAFMDVTPPDIIELMFDFWSEAIRGKDSQGAMLNHMKKFYDAYKDIFTDVIVQGMGEGSFRRDLNPRNIASFIVGALDGVLVQWVLDKVNFDYRDVVKSAGETILNGITTRNASTGENEILPKSESTTDSKKVVK